MNRSLISAIAAASVGLAAAGASAQPAPPPGPHARHAPGDMKAIHEQMARRHADDLKIVLRLRPDQEPALNAFLASHRPARIDMKRGGLGETPLTTPERLEQMARAETAMNAARDGRRDALARFYAALGPDQQKVFDALQRLQGPGGGRGMRHVTIRKGPGGPGSHGGHGAHGGGRPMMHAPPHG